MERIKTTNIGHPIRADLSNDREIHRMKIVISRTLAYFKNKGNRRQYIEAC